MNVYEFEKTLLERMEESYNVLQCKGSAVPASDVRDEWACHVELKIEPAGEFGAKNLFDQFAFFCTNFLNRIYAFVMNFTF